MDRTGPQHSRHYIHMAVDTDRRRFMENPDGYGKRTGMCGDTVEIFLRVRGDRITRVCFLSDGCINTHACANTVAFLAEDKPLNAAWEISPETVIGYLETLPEAHVHCAELAVGAFYLALSDCRALKKRPWEKFYTRRG